MPYVMLDGRPVKIVSGELNLDGVKMPVWRLSVTVEDESTKRLTKQDGLLVGTIGYRRTLQFSSLKDVGVLFVVYTSESVETDLSYGWLGLHQLNAHANEKGVLLKVTEADNLTHPQLVAA